MRRAAAAIVSTVVGLVLLLSFKTHAHSVALGLNRPPAISPGQGSQSSGTSQSTSRAGSGSSGGSGSQSSSGGASGTVQGDAVDTRYGPVQVQITVSGGKITDIQPVQLPMDNPRDMEINNFAVPVLNQEALAAQNAQIDMVSGATYTSQGYIDSLQSALDKAGL